MERIGSPPGSTPETLLARYRADGRPGDLAGLFDATAPELFRLALHLCPDAATAEDVLQETFLVVLERASSWDPDRPAMPWLTGILKNQALMARRRAARRPDPRRMDEPAPPDDPALEAVDAEEKELLRAAMQRLPEPYRGVALLRWRYGLEPTEIADVKGVPPGTVWTWLHRAVQKMKVEMGALPALLLAFRPERGLDSIRSALLRRAAAQALATEAAAGATASTAALTLGGLLMANKTLVAAVAAVALVAGGWFLLRPGPPVPSPAPGPSVTRARSPGQAPPPKSPPTSPTPETAKVVAIPDPVDLSKCDRDLDLFGVVVDGKDAPVAGAQIRTLSHPWRDVAPLSMDRRFETKDGPSTLSARDGTFVLRLHRGQSVDLRAIHPDFVPAQVARCLAGEKLRVVMTEGSRLEVAVRDSEGNPVAGARVRLWRIVQVLGVDYEAEAVSDATGRWVFKGLTPGRWTLAVEHDQYGVPDWQSPEIPATGIKSIEVVLPRGRNVEGRVTDARTGKPIPGARVGGNWVLTRPTTTDAEGHYAWRDWTGKGFDDLHVTAEGYGRQGKSVPAEGPLDFALEPGDRLVGRVVGSDGAPVAGAVLGCVASSRTNQGQEIDAASGTSGPDGRFELRSLRHDLPHLLVISAPGYGRGLFDFLPPGESPGKVDLGDVVLAAPRAIEGSVLDAAGEPLRGTAVSLAGGDDDRRRFLPTGVPALDINYGVGLACRTDDLGRFRFPDLPPGHYRLTARSDAAVIAVDVAVVVPPDHDVLDVVLRAPERSSRSLTVVLQDDTGAPVEGLKVIAIVGRERVEKNSGPDGRARFESLGADEVNLQVFEFPFDRPRRFLWPRPSPVKPEGQEVVLVLRRAGEIRGTVLSPDRKPLGGMSVAAVDSSGTWVGSAFAKEDGSFSVPAGLGDTVDLKITGQRVGAPKASGRMDESSPYRGLRAGVVCPAEGVEIVTSVVESNRKLTVRVLDLQGNPMPHVPVTILKPGERVYPMTGEDGRLTVEGLLAEEIKVSALMPALVIGGPPPLPEGSTLPAPVSVVPDGQEITLQLRQGVPAVGIVYDSEGSPAEKARVDLQTTDFVVSSGTTGADGRFKVWIAPDLKLRWASAYTFAERGMKEQAQIQEADLAKMGSDLVFRLKPAETRR